MRTLGYFLLPLMWGHLYDMINGPCSNREVLLCISLTPQRPLPLDNNYVHVNNRMYTLVTVYDLYIVKSLPYSWLFLCGVNTTQCKKI